MIVYILFFPGITPDDSSISNLATVAHSITLGANDLFLLRRPNKEMWDGHTYARMLGSHEGD